MNNVQYTSEGNPNQPLILNDNLNFTMDFSFWGAEVDLLSILVSGKKSIINPEDLKAYMQGVFDLMDVPEQDRKLYSKGYLEAQVNVMQGYLAPGQGDAGVNNASNGSHYI